MSRFGKKDGDEYFNRNFKPLSQLSLDCIDSIFTRFPFVPEKLLEVGCCFGKILERYREITGAECHGVDISELAISEGRQRYPMLKLQNASATALPYEDDFFDCVFLGGCLCLQNPRDLFTVAAETDRVLQKMGCLLSTIMILRSRTVIYFLTIPQLTRIRFLLEICSCGTRLIL